MYDYVRILKDTVHSLNAFVECANVDIKNLSDKVKNYKAVLERMRLAEATREKRIETLSTDNEHSLKRIKDLKAERDRYKLASETFKKERDTSNEALTSARSEVNSLTAEVLEQQRVIKKIGKKKKS